MDREPREGGMGPLSWLLYKLRYRRLEREPSEGGMGPVSLLPSK